MAFVNHPIHRHLVSRAYPQAIADLNVLKRDFLFAAIRADDPRRFRRQIQQRADRISGPFPGAEFQYLAEQYENHDHGRSLEIDADMASGIAESRWKDARRDGRDDTERIGRANAHGDEREHVQAAVDDGFDATDQERPSRPEDDRRRQHELGPSRDSLADPPAHGQAQHGTHRERQNRNRQRGPDPEAGG